MIRKLASIRTIGSVSPIEGADNIELVTVDGWQCVAKKGEFIAGQFCVYFEIDSFLPIREEFEFLRKSSYRKMGDKEGFRLRTIKLRGQVSQGLVMPANTFSELRYSSETDIFGLDITDILCVLKYDPPIPAQLAGIRKWNFPSFIRKTDQERVQNLWSKVKSSEETFEVTFRRTIASLYFQEVKHVPILEDKHMGSFKSINDILSFADAPKGISFSDGAYEGVVFKSNNSDLTFKVISNKYLLKEKE